MLSAISHLNHAEGVHIINAKHCISPTRSVVYHKAAGRSSPKGADEIQGRNAPLMIYAALRASMIYQACGLDKQKKELLVDKSSLFVGRGDGI